MKAIFILLLTSFTLQAALPQGGKDHKIYRQNEHEIWLSLAEENNKLNLDNDAINGKTKELIHGFASYECILGDFPEGPELLLKARILEKMKPKSPLAKLFIGQIILSTSEGTYQDLSDGYKYINESTEVIRSKSYSPLAKFISSCWLRRTTYKGVRINGKKVKDIHLNHRDALFNYILTKNENGEARFKYKFIKKFFTYDIQRNHIEDFHKKTLKNKSKMDPWLYEMILANYTSIKGALSTPKKASQEELRKHHTQSQKLSSQHLKNAFKLDPTKPEAAVELMYKTHSHQQNSPRTWFEKAISIEFDNPDAYKNYLLVLHSVDNLIAFGRECSSTGRYDTLVPFQHIEATKRLYKKLKYNYPLIKKMKLYDEIHEVFKAYEKNELQNKVFLNRNRNYFRARHLGYAYRIGRYTHVRKLHQLFGESLNVKSVLDDFYMKYETAIPLSYAMSGPASKLVDQLFKKFYWDSMPGKHQWRSQNELNHYVKMYEEAKGMTSEKESEKFFKVLGEIIDIEKKFHNNDWVNLKFTKDLRLWQIYGGNWKYIDEHTVEANNLNSKSQYLSSNAFFRPPYIMEVDVESIKSNWRGNHLFAGLIIGRMQGPKTGRAFWVDGLRKKTGTGVPGKDPQAYDIKNKTRKNKLSVYVWDGYAEIHVNNGSTWLTKTDKNFVPLRSGLGIMPTLGVSGIVRYSNVRVKKLNIGPPPKNSDSNEKLAYYSQRMQLNDIKADYEHMAISLQSLNKNEEALDIIAKMETKWKSWWIPYYKHVIYSNLKNYKRATAAIEESYKQALSYGKSQNTVRNALAWYLATCPDETFRNTDRAIKLSKESLKAKVKDSTKAQYLDTYGVSLANSGKFKEGIKYLNQALKKISNNDKLKFAIKKRIESFKQNKIYIDIHEDE